MLSILSISKFKRSCWSTYCSYE